MDAASVGKWIVVFGLGLVVAGGLLYTAGAVVYATRRPDIFPRWFGFHEVFHVFVMLGSTAHFWAIYRYLTV